MKSESNKLLVSTVKRLLYRQAHQKLAKVIERTHPADLGLVLDHLHHTERGAFFDALTQHDAAAAVLVAARPDARAPLLASLPPQRLSLLFEHMDPDDVADLLAEIDDDTKRDALLAMMRRDDFVTTQSLLEHDPQSAGGIMSPDVFALPESTTAAQALRALQEDAGQTEVVFYLYVTNEHRHLVGVVTLRALVLSAPETPLSQIMLPEVIRAQVDTDQEEVARLIARYNLIALPIVDANNQLVGAVTVDDIIDVIRLEATEDMMLMAGAGEPEGAHSDAGALGLARARAPKLWPNFLAGTAVLLGAAFAWPTISPAWPLVATVPLAMMVAGGAGRQSATVVSRRLSLGQLAGRRWPVALHEALAGLVTGLGWSILLGIALGLILSQAWFQLPSAPIPWVAGAAGALTLATTLAALIGAASPLALSRLGLDPAVSTGPQATALIDLVAVASCLAPLPLLL